jgi:hypothetical protein
MLDELIEHFAIQRVIDIATFKSDLTEQERIHLKVCEKCQHLVVFLNLEIPDEPTHENAA